MDTPPAHNPNLPALVCFSHLRWDFVYQRPQHLMSRFARARDVLFVEEPLYEDADAHLRSSQRPGGVEVLVPVLPAGLEPADAIRAQRSLLTDYLASREESYTFWFQTPMAFAFAPVELAATVIYDCMDELSAFKDAPAALMFSEKRLLARADLVFTGGRALYEAKRLKHPNVHCFPSSIDVAHFRRARGHRHGAHCAPELAGMPHPQVGFSGVIDERMNVALVEAVAVMRPDVQFVFVGPVVKIDPAILPRRDNIHYLGLRDYADLPQLMAEWDVAMMPFARNEATRFISPTKTPEYLAAGLPVVSTGIRDVVADYGAPGLVSIADDPPQFAAAIDAAIGTRDDSARLRAVDIALSTNSWNTTWTRMAALERTVAVDRAAKQAAAQLDAAAEVR